MKKIWKNIVPLCVALSLALSCATPALACTGLYVGGQASANGSTYMGRSEDIGGDHTKIFGYSPAADYPEDYIYEDAYGFSYPYGGHVYAYVYCKDSPEYEETMTDGEGNYIFEAYAEAGQNEMGVSISETVTIGYNAAAQEADPLVDGYEVVNEDGSTGLCEISIGTLVLGKAATAREGVDLLARIIDEKGSGECNSLMISDPNETWYFEQVSGHQYAAIKLPDDKVSVQPNIALLGGIDVADVENVVASPALVSLAEQNGFLVADEVGGINVCKTYGEESSGSAQYVRYYQGLFYLHEAEAQALDWQVVPADNRQGYDVVTADGAPIDGNALGNGLELLHDADHALTTLEVLQLLAARGEGTDGFDATKDGVYAIGNQNTAEAHVFEIREDMPLELATLEWLALSPAEFSIFLPSYSTILTQVSDLFDETALEYTEGSLFWVFSQINALCAQDRENCAAQVKEYFAKYQQSIIDQQTVVDAQMLALYEIDPDGVSEAANALHAQLAQQVYAMADSVLKDLEIYVQHGDVTAPFQPSTAAQNIMPSYTLDAGGTAYPSTQAVKVDGVPVELQMYALKNAQGDLTNYVKVRDVAAALNGTEAQFDVQWEAGRVDLQTGAPYAHPNGQENQAPYSWEKPYTLSTQMTKVDGKPASLAAFLLQDDDGSGSTYYKLRDLGEALGFNVGWDGAQVFLETDKPYSDAD